MAKTPRIGRGKSRLARDVGRVEAWRINRALHVRTMRIARNPRWKTVLAVSPDRDLNAALPGVWPSTMQRLPQGAGDLGARMTRAMARARGPVAIIGTDCPDATTRDVAAAFAALQRVSIAIGPAEDGGFWILAARRGRDVVRLFRGIRWSSAHTLADVEARAPWPPARLRALADIDTQEDWKNFLRRQRAP